MIDKLNLLTEEEQKQFYRELTSRLVEVFASDYYDDEEDLQADFHEWKNGDRNDYHNTVDEILADIAPEGIELNWRDLKKLNYKRWHLCRSCNNPFIAYDTFNRIKVCYAQDYRKYIVGKVSNDSYREGFQRKYTENGKSLCYANRRQQITKEYRMRKTS